MVPLLSGLCGCFVAAYLSFKHDWPGISILVFATLGFLAMYGMGLFIVARAIA